MTSLHLKIKQINYKKPVKMIKRGSKKAQVTIFVLIAIVLVAGVLFYLLVMPKITRPALSAEEAQKLLASQIEPIKKYTQDCMKTVSGRILNTIGRQGGYIIPRPDRFTIPTGIIPDPMVINYALFYDKGLGSYINLLPSVEEICQSELKSFVGKDPTFTTCINSYDEWKKEFDIEVGNLNISEVRCGDIIYIAFKQPVKISRSGSTTTVDNYVVTFPINIPRIRDLASRIINKIVLGQSFAEAMVEEAQNQWKDMKSNPDFSETMTMQTYTFREPPSSASDSIYNELNMLFKIEYNNKALDKPFEFYFLSGIK